MKPQECAAARLKAPPSWVGVELLSACLNCPESPDWHLTQDPQMEIALFVEMMLRKSKSDCSGFDMEESEPASLHLSCPGVGAQAWL